MKNLQITPPEGYEIDEKQSTFTNIVFKPLILKQTAEEKMEEIWKSCNVVKYSSDNCRTYFKDNGPIFQQDWRNKKLYYSYSLVYKIFDKEFSMSEQQINELVIKTLSKDLNCSSLTEGLREGSVGDGWWF